MKDFLNIFCKLYFIHDRHKCYQIIFIFSFQRIGSSCRENRNLQEISNKIFKKIVRVSTRKLQMSKSNWRCTHLRTKNQCYGRKITKPMLHAFRKQTRCSDDHLLCQRHRWHCMLNTIYKTHKECWDKFLDLFVFDVLMELCNGDMAHLLLTIFAYTNFIACNDNEDL